jgi:hypothetical protein
MWQPVARVQQSLKVNCVPQDTQTFREQELPLWDAEIGCNYQFCLVIWSHLINREDIQKWKDTTGHLERMWEMEFVASHS